MTGYQARQIIGERFDREVLDKLSNAEVLILSKHKDILERAWAAIRDQIVLHMNLGTRPDAAGPIIWKRLLETVRGGLLLLKGDKR